MMKVSRWKEIIKIRADIKQIKSKNMTQKINEFKNWLFEKTKKSDNIYSDSSKKKKKQKKNAIRNETGEITSKKYKGL